MPEPRFATHLRLDGDKVGADNPLPVTVIGGGGGGGDASAANQLIEINRLEQIRDKIIASPATEATLASLLAAVLTDAQLRATPVAVSGPLTDVELRATPVPVSGTVGISGTVTTTVGLTDAELRATPVAVLPNLPSASSITIVDLSTSGSGTPFVTFTSTACRQLEIINLTGTTIEYQRGGAGAAFPIPNNSARLIIGITNANQIGIRRQDQSTTVVTVQAEIFSNVTA